MNLYPPGPKLSRLDGFMLATRRRDPLAFLMKLARDYGDIVHFEIGPRHVFLLNHPDYIRDALNAHYQYFLKGPPRRQTRHFLGEGLVTSDGDFHRRQRRLVKPAFHKQQVTAYEGVMMDHIMRLCESWQDGQEIEMMREMKCLTMAIIGSLLFSIETRPEADEINEAVELVFSQFTPFGSPFRNLLARLPMSRVRRIHKAQAHLDAIIRRIIAERRRSGEDCGDLLSMLIRAQDEAEPGAAMTDVNVRDEALTLFLSGHETMAMALTWTWYLLAQDHEVEAKLQAEIDDVLGAGPPSLAAVSELHYAKMVFTEAMRLYPPAWCIVRYVIKDYEVGGYAMPAGSTVIMSQYVMHRDERYFPDPSRFDPQRWTPEAKSARPQYSYFPFGGGPRVCVGDALAWAEGVLILASLAQRWRMHLPPGHNVTAKPMIALVPKHGMPMILEQREASSDT